MAENKKSFLLYADILAMVSKLPDEIAGKLFKIILEYVNDKNPIVDDLLLSIAFEPIKLQLKRDLAKYETIKETSSENGIIGNLKRWHLDLYNDFISKKITLDKALSIAESRKSSPPDERQSPPIGFIAVNDTDSVNVNDTVTVTVKEKKNNTKRTIEQFREIARKSFENCKCCFGNDFKKEWFVLIQSENWRKKDQNAYDYNLKRLMKFEEVFSIALIESAIAGSYKGVVFPNTNESYQKYLKQKLNSENGNSKAESRGRLADMARAILNS
jgi:hypothetical protein